MIKGKYDYAKFAKLLHDRIEIFSEIPDMVAFIASFGEIDKTLYEHKKMKTDASVALTCMTEAIEDLASIESFDETSIHDALIAGSEKLGVKKGQMLFTVRVGLTGCASTPGGAVEMADILGKEESIARLKKAVVALQ